jgi:hypothetical protein
VNNKLVVGTILGQAVITLTAIGYGFLGALELGKWSDSAGSRVSEPRCPRMATAMKGAGDRLVTMEKELARCQVRARPAARPAAEGAGGATSCGGARADALGGLASRAEHEEALQALASPMTWTPQTRGESASPITTLPWSWCAGRYERASGNNFGPCAPSRP